MSRIKRRPTVEDQQRNIERIEREVADLRSRGIEPEGCDFVDSEAELMSTPIRGKKGKV